ncbi:hypothetical protein SAY86_003971 [Trapa natans]|uniref:Uncharacterized protein n=1 Tax=Trapa natans TaxID=22666 RepID=A0AAN7RFA8_TRANT|nr:hypothetical protein SAY86_003971 [Trapa natans]
MFHGQAVVGLLYINSVDENLCIIWDCNEILEKELAMPMDLGKCQALDRKTWKMEKETKGYKKNKKMKARQI